MSLLNTSKSYFAAHPATVTVLYFTSDGLAFFEKGKAEDHGNTLEDTNVTTITRAEAEAESEEAKETIVSKYAGMSLTELQELCKGREIKFAHNTKEAKLIASLDAWDVENPTEGDDDGDDNSEQP